MVQAVWPFIDYRKYGNGITQPELEYFAPECGLGETQGPASDIFSLGILIYALHNSGQPPFRCKDFRAYNNYISQVLYLNKLVWCLYLKLGVEVKNTKCCSNQFSENQTIVVFLIFASKLYCKFFKAFCLYH